MTPGIFPVIGGYLLGGKNMQNSVILAASAATAARPSLWQRLSAMASRGADSATSGVTQDIRNQAARQALIAGRVTREKAREIRQGKHDNGPLVREFVMFQADLLETR